MKQEDITCTKFIKNDVCGNDLFEGKSHEDTARAIKNIITRKDSCSIIGVDGGWGSGKSNLVKLTEKEIYSDGDLNKNGFRFFTYDAWGHQEDLQRRSILEELIDDLIELKKIVVNNEEGQEEIILPIFLKDEWKGKLENLLAKRKKNTTETVPKLGIGFIVSALVLVLTPIANIIAELIPEGCVIVRLIITILPLILGILYLRRESKRNLIKRGEKFTFKNALTEMFLLYKDEVKTNTTYENISEREPSSREFKQWMGNIDTDLEENTLVIVFDNMDRLPKNKVQELWATIHTFFADCNYKNIKIIVPFDRTHIISAFKDEDSDDDICYGDDYINKTFDVIFRVAPPTMSNWSDYFNLKWQEVFGKKEHADNKTLQIFDAYTAMLTPRKIIAFINELASIRQMDYAKGIPCEYIALFIFGKTKIYNNPNVEVLNPTYLNSTIEYLYKNDTELSQYISALYYQLTPQKAMDIVNVDKLKRALDAGSIKFVDNIKDSPAFKHILNKSICEVKNIQNAVTTLYENDKCTSSNWVDVYKRLEVEKNDALTHKELQDYQVMLLLKLSGKIRQKYLQGIITDFYANNTVEDAMKLRGYILKLSEALNNKEPYNCLKDIQIEPAHFINFVKEAKNDWKQFKISCTQELLNKHFATFSLENIEHFDVYKYLKDSYNFDSYTERLSELIDENIASADNMNLQILYDRLKEVNKPVTKILTETELYTLKTRVSEGDPFYYDMICMRISLFANMRSYATYFETDMNNVEGLFVEEITKQIEYYIDYGTLLLNLQTFDKPLFKAVVKKITEKSYGVSSMSIATVLPQYESILSILEISSSVLTNRLNDWSKYAKEKITIDNVNSIPLMFFKDIQSEQIDNKLTTHCVDIAKKYLDSLSKESWVDAIKTGNYDFRLLETLTPKLSQSCVEALDDILKEYANGTLVSINENYALTILGMAERDKRGITNIFKNIGKGFITTPRITPSLFKFYGRWLFKYGKLNESKDALSAIFPPSIVGDDDCLGIMMSHRELMISIVNNAGDEVKEFKAKIQDMLDKETYNTEIGFESFANTLGVHRTEITNDNNEPE